MVKCSAYGCGNRQKIREGVSFYKFPLDPVRREKWVVALRRGENWKPTEHSRLCSEHFLGGQKSDNPQSPDFVPSIFYNVSAKMKIKQQENFQSYKRIQQMRRRLELEHDYVVSLTKVTEEDRAAHDTCEWSPDWMSNLLNLDHTELLLCKPSEHVAGQEAVHRLQSRTEVKVEEIETVIVGGHENIDKDKPVVKCHSCAQKSDEIQKLREKIQTIESVYASECSMCKLRRDEINRLLEENRVLKSQLEKVNLEEPSLKDNKRKVQYYTGLPDFEAFTVVMNAVESFLPKNVRNLSPFQMVVLTFMRLRLNLPLRFLIYQFQTNWRSLMVAFTQTISALNAQFSKLIQWPSREALQAASPLLNPSESLCECVAVIVEILDVLTYQGPTVKYLICVTSDQMTFVSKRCEDNVIEKHVIEQSGILEKLKPGDWVMGEYVYKLIENAKGRRCLSELPTEAAEGNRFPVKKAVMNLRRFAILTGEVSPSLLRPCEGEDLTLLDKVVRVCCALTVMWPHVTKESSTTE